MKSAGYMIGKWHLGQSEGYYPLDRGFDEFFGITAGATAFLTESQSGYDTYNPPGSEGSFGTTASDLAANVMAGDERISEIRRRAPVMRGREVVEVPVYLTEAFTDDALRFIGANRDRPSFLYLAYNAPHTPLQATKKYLDRYPHVPDRGKRVYAAMVSSLNDGVGATRAKLKAEGLADGWTSA